MEDGYEMGKGNVERLAGVSHNGDCGCGCRPRNICASDGIPRSSHPRGCDIHDSGSDLCGCRGECGELDEAPEHTTLDDLIPDTRSTKGGKGEVSTEVLVKVSPWFEFVDKTKWLVGLVFKWRF